MYQHSFASVFGVFFLYFVFIVSGVYEYKNTCLSKSLFVVSLLLCIIIIILYL